MIFIIDTIWALFQINKYDLITISFQQVGGKRGPVYIGIMLQTNYTAIPARVLTMLSYIYAWRFFHFVMRRTKQMSNTLMANAIIQTKGENL